MVVAVIENQIDALGGVEHLQVWRVIEQSFHPALLKANVANALHMIIRNLAALYLRVYDPEFANSFGDGLEVSEGKDGFLVKGKMNPNEVNVHFSVSKWATDYLDKSVQELIDAFREAARDHKITLEEKIGLIKLIRTVLLQCIQSFYLIRTGAVFR